MTQASPGARARWRNPLRQGPARRGWWLGREQGAEPGGRPSSAAGLFFSSPPPPIILSARVGLGETRSNPSFDACLLTLRAETAEVRAVREARAADILLEGWRWRDETKKKGVRKGKLLSLISSRRAAPFSPPLIVARVRATIAAVCLLLPPRPGSQAVTHTESTLPSSTATPGPPRRESEGARSSVAAHCCARLSAVTHAHFWPPTMTDNYHVTELVGEGSFGKVSVRGRGDTQGVRAPACTLRLPFFLALQPRSSRLGTLSSLPFFNSVGLQGPAQAFGPGGRPQVHNQGRKVEPGPGGPAV